MSVKRDLEKIFHYLKDNYALEENRTDKDRCASELFRFIKGFIEDGFDHLTLYKLKRIRSEYIKSFRIDRVLKKAYNRTLELASIDVKDHFDDVIDDVKRIKN